MLRKLAVFVLVTGLFAGGCASIPGPKATVGRGSRVVLINVLDPALTNAHMGATVFGNYRESIENDWNIPGRADAGATALLSNEGYEVVKVDPVKDRVEPLRRGDQISMGWSDFHVDHAYAQWFHALMEQHKAAAVVVLRGFDLNVVPDSVAKYGGYGIMSTMGFKPARAVLYAFVGAQVFSGDPVVWNPGSRQPFGCAQSISTADLPADNLKDLTAAHLAPHRATIEKFVDRRIAQDLGASGLVNELVPLCEFQRE